MKKIDEMESSLRELARMAGWDLDATLLEACLEARISIGHLRSTVLDDSDDAIDAVTEHMLDLHIHSQRARQKLLELAGEEDE